MTEGHVCVCVQMCAHVHTWVVHTSACLCVQSPEALSSVWGVSRIPWTQLRPAEVFGGSHPCLRGSSVKPVGTSAPVCKMHGSTWDMTCPWGPAPHARP